MGKACLVFVALCCSSILNVIQDQLRGVVTPGPSCPAALGYNGVESCHDGAF